MAFMNQMFFLLPSQQSHVTEGSTWQLVGKKNFLPAGIFASFLLIVDHRLPM